MNTVSTPDTSQAWTRLLLRCGVAAGPVFVAVFLLEGAVRDGYRQLRHPVSSLALGPQSPRLVNVAGLFQRTSIITGFAWLTALSARALRRTPATTAARRRA